MTIAFIGLGRMGAPMAANLLRAGHDLTVYDLDPAAVERLVSDGARPASSPAGAASGADTVITMLPTSAIVETVLFGDDGVIDTLSTDAVVIDMSTSRPDDSDSFRERLDPIAFVDAPVAGTSDRAIAGTLIVLAGGRPDDVTRARAVFEALSESVVDCGGPGRGIRMKIVNNAMSIALNALSGEVVTLAERFGLDAADVIEVFASTPAGRGHFTTTWPDKVLAGDLTPAFTVDLAHKDLQIAVEVGRSLHVPMPSAAGALLDFSRARHNGRGGEDWTAVLADLREESLRPRRR